jgi:hypothetical protein
MTSLFRSSFGSRWVYHAREGSTRPCWDPALAEAVARPFESFSSEEQAELLKRLDYEGLSTPSPTLIPN